MTERTGARPLDQMLSKREQQVMEVVHARGEVTAAEVYEALPDAPSYNAVRGVLRLLEERGHVVHEREGPRYVYRAAVSAEDAARAAAHQLARTFFSGSRVQLVNMLLESEPPSERELDRLQRLIDEARRLHERGGAEG